jgi:hypothetical protein
MRKPDFFIVGAGKCGTTALWTWLRGHPRIFMCPVKEPRYFADDMPRLMNRVANEADYLDLFKKAAADHLAVGEASPQYIYSANAIRNIRAFNPEARLIAMLRNPVDMAHAAHAECLYWFVEDERDFEKAWRLQTDRREGLRVPAGCSQVTVLLWADMCRLGQQVERMLSVFPREQVHFILLEDLATDAKGVYEGALAFLGVPSDGRTEFPRLNAGKAHRSRFLGRMVQQPPRPLAAFRRFIEKRLGLYGVWPRLRRMNTRPATRPVMREEFRRELVEEFRADVDKLARLTGRDLSNWHK